MINNIESILTDFNDCLGIPIQFINNKNEITHKIGFSDDIESLIAEVSLYENLKVDILSNMNLTYFNNIHFLVIPSLYSRLRGSFIIGPFKTKYICNDLNIPFKPYSCIKHISSMLKDIIKDKIKNESHLNPYVKDSIRYIHTNYEYINMDDVCSHLNINKHYFCEIFKRDTGYTFTNFLNKFRVEKSKELLLNNSLSISQVASSVGYNSQNYYSILFKKLNGVSPIQYRSKSKTT